MEGESHVLRFKNIALLLAGAFALGALAAAPATAVSAEAQIFYAGCDNYGDAPGRFAVSFKSPTAAMRSILIRQVGTPGFEETAPVPANVREARWLPATSDGNWNVVVRLNSDTGPILAQKTVFVSCPGQ